MDNEHMDAVNGNPDIPSPALPERPKFSANKREIAAALLMFLLAFCYTGIWDEKWIPWLTSFAVGFVILTEYVYFGLQHKKESWVWLGCMLIILLSMVCPKLSISRFAGFEVTERVWDISVSALFLHAFAVYWVLARSWRLSEGESGRLLPLDALQGLIIFPFKHFFLRIRTIFFGIRQIIPQKNSAKPVQTVGTIIAVIAALWLFTTAADLLGAADSGFSALTDRLTDFFHIEWNGETVLRILFSLPVGAYLFGLIAGTGRENPLELKARGERTISIINALKVVPGKFWIAVLAVFSALYASFFLLQGSYLFGAFTRTLPEGFIVSQYAREGFFELCKVMALNFALLWCVTRSSSRPVKESRMLLGMCTAMLVESMLFAVIAFSKLALYIDCFGFTPLRLQSSWLVCVLFAGCAAAMISLLTRKKTMKTWMIFSAAALALLHLY